MTQTNLASPGLAPGHKCEICGLETATKRGMSHHKTTVHRVLGPRTEKNRAYRKRIKNQKARQVLMDPETTITQVEAARKAMVETIEAPETTITPPRPLSPMEWELLKSISDKTHQTFCGGCGTLWEGTPGPYCGECGSPTTPVKNWRTIRVD